VFRFGDVLIRIGGSVPLVTELDPRLFQAFKMPTKIKFFPSVFCLFLTVGTFTSVFKDDTLLGRSKLWKSRFFCLLMEGSGSALIIMDPDT